MLHKYIKNSMFKNECVLNLLVLINRYKIFRLLVILTSTRKIKMVQPIKFSTLRDCFLYPKSLNIRRLDYT